VVMMPILSQANASLNRLSFLSQSLQTAAIEEIGEPRDISSFESLEIQDICYEHRNNGDGDVSFSVGPVNFSLTAGEVVFIFGGNGSGKTTLINMMTGLYAASKGTFYLNGCKVDDTASVAYKCMFAPVFNDFHLFDEFYGTERVDEEKVKEYLSLFELEGKVEFTMGKFTTIDLSTGQRKRLALICAMLENKPILVMDEFAADQDPYFRRKFYTQILKVIRKEGFTVIAVTHDDNYYECCDTLYKMDAGQLQVIREHPEAVPIPGSSLFT